MFKDRKGQGAMEYLMTYGWAILVVMIVGIVMWQLGIFGGGPVGSCSMAGFSTVKPQLMLIQAKSSGSFHGSFLNAQGLPVTVTGYNFQYGGNSVAAATGLNIGVGANEHWVVDTTVDGLSSLNVGDSYTINAEIDYDVSAAGQTLHKTSAGSITCTVE
ncbi:MAG: hypothetical protein GF334_09565 [Candidatus Altiarchaeales archaeon]|nr:hypothetical protein [Candidatus Altiarchaeales archaeon]